MQPPRQLLLFLFALAPCFLVQGWTASDTSASPKARLRPPPAPPAAATPASSWDNDADKLIARIVAERDPLTQWLLLADLEELSNSISAPDQFPLALEKLTAIKGLAWWVRERIDLMRFTALRQLGRHDEASQLATRLGFVTRGKIIGSFENEGGVGMQTVYDPEEVFIPGVAAEGKLRPVQWRTLPSDWASSGWIPLGSLLYPSDSVAGYVLVGLRAENSVQAKLSVNFSESLAVWFNGEPLYHFDGKRDAGLEPAHLPLSLRRGVNLLLCKVGSDGGGDLGVSLRVTARDRPGLPAGVTVVDDDDSLQQAGARLLPVRQELVVVTPLPGPEEAARRAVAQARNNSEKAAAMTVLARTLNLVRNFDREQRRDEEVLSQALALTPTPDFEMLLLQADLADKPQIRVEALEHAYLLEPHDPRLVVRFVPELQSIGAGPRSVRVVKEALIRHPDDAELILLDLDFLGGLTHVGQAWRELSAWHSRAPRNRRLLRASLAAAARLGFVKQEQDLRSAWAAWDADPENLRWMLSHAMAIYDADGAAALIGRLIQAEPWDLGHRLTAIQLLVGGGKIEQARQRYRDLMAALPDNPNILDEAALFESLQGDEEESVRLWKEELSLRPQDPELKERLAVLERQDGFALPYLEDAEALVKAVAPSEDPNSNGEVLLDQRIIRVYPNGLSSSYRQVVIRVLTEEGRRRWRYVMETYYGGRQESRLKKARILRPGQGEISPLPDVSVPMNQNDGMTYDMWIHAVKLEALQVGDVFEVQLELDDTAAENIFHEYFGDLLYTRDTVPVHLLRYTLLAPVSRQVYYNAPLFCPVPQITDSGDVRIYRWEGRDLPRVKEEPGLPGAAEVLDPLLISTYKDWSAFDVWYRRLIKDQFVAGPPIADKVAQLTKNIDDPYAKMAALFRYAANEVRYIAIELGIHSYKPYQANEIFQRGWGDCKDKATLLIAMLKEAGIPASMVLVRTRNLGKLKPEPATLAMFNHAIVYVPQFDRYLDATVRFHDTATLPWQDQGAQVLHLKEDGVALTEIPIEGSETNRMQSEATVHLVSEQEITLSWKSVATGVWAGMYRQQMQDKGQQQVTVERTFNRNYPGTKITAVAIKGVTQEEDPLTIEAEAVMGGYVRRQGEGALSIPVDLGVMDLGQTAALSERINPLVMPFPYTDELSVTVTLPPGFSVVKLPPAADVNSPFGAFSISCRPASPTDPPQTAAVCRHRFSLNVTRVEPLQYAEFRNFIQQVLFLRTQMVEVRHAI